MTRDIKFRCYIASDYNKPKKMFYNYDPFILGIDNPRSPPVMQYTGLKDKNGKEVYEGDIVNYKARDLGEPLNNHISVVEFDPTCGYTPWCYSDGEGLYQVVDKSIEIIGNIYENPALLGDSK